LKAIHVGRSTACIGEKLEIAIFIARSQLITF
jgi:hypothetical protein